MDGLNSKNEIKGHSLSQIQSKNKMVFNNSGVKISSYSLRDLFMLQNKTFACL